MEGSTERRSAPGPLGPTALRDGAGTFGDRAARGGAERPRRGARGGRVRTGPTPALGATWRRPGDGRGRRTAAERPRPALGAAELPRGAGALRPGPPARDRRRRCGCGPGRHTKAVPGGAMRALTGGGRTLQMPVCSAMGRILWMKAKGSANSSQLGSNTGHSGGGRNSAMARPGPRRHRRRLGTILRQPPGPPSASNGTCASAGRWGVEGRGRGGTKPERERKRVRPGLGGGRGRRPPRPVTRLCEGAPGRGRRGEGGDAARGRPSSEPLRPPPPRFLPRRGTSRAARSERWPRAFVRAPRPSCPAPLPPAPPVQGAPAAPCRRPGRPPEQLLGAAPPARSRSQRESRGGSPAVGPRGAVRGAGPAVFTCAEGSAQLTAAAAGASFFKEPLRRLPLAAPRTRHRGAGPDRAARPHCLRPRPGGRRRSQAASLRHRYGVVAVPFGAPRGAPVVKRFRFAAGAPRGPVPPSSRAAQADSAARRAGGSATATERDVGRGRAPRPGAAPPRRGWRPGPAAAAAPHVAHVRAGPAPPPVRAPRTAVRLRLAAVGAAAAPRGSAPYSHARVASRPLRGPVEAPGTVPTPTPSPPLPVRPGRHVRSAALSCGSARPQARKSPFVKQNRARGLNETPTAGQSFLPSSKTHAVLSKASRYCVKLPCCARWGARVVEGDAGAV